MESKKIRVRFAPSPTGFMHLGNARTALLNYLFARKHNGTFVLRIEDTDPARNFDPQAQHIISDLSWLGFKYDEGPAIEGAYGPYFQSERNNIYKEYLQKLIDKKLAYRCFCTTDELEKKRQQQIALKMPPRYDQTCSKLSKSEIQVKLDNKTPFIWRMKTQIYDDITITDLARGAITFNLKHFSDFPLTRTNGSFTFIFSNAIDDALMKISHVLRGEDHLSNTASQAIIYQALDFEIPSFWHLPILCNITGKKLSKRDFGFSLKDLKAAGFLPEALANYLAIIGSGSFKNEIMNLEELVKNSNFSDIHSTGHIKYDIEKLKWVNHKWIDKYDPEKLTRISRPFIESAYPQAEKLDDKKLTSLIQTLKTDITTLADLPEILSFYFEKPQITPELLNECISPENKAILANIITKNISLLANPDEFVKTLKNESKAHNIPLKSVFWTLRTALTGKPKGPAINDLINMLGTDETNLRINKILQ